MTRLLLTFLLAGLSFGCATTASNSYSLAEKDSLESPTRRSLEISAASFTPVAADPEPLVTAGLLAPVSTTATTVEFEPAPMYYAPVLGEDDSDSYFVLKAGVYNSEDDSTEDGVIVSGAFGRRILNWLALELEIGYVDADGTDAAFRGDMWAIPVMLNGRVDIQILIVKLYGGVGIGGFYYDVERSDGISDFEEDGFIFGGNAFIGASVVLGGLSAGLEAKAYVSEDIDDFDDPLAALAVMLTLGFGI